MKIRILLVTTLLLLAGITLRSSLLQAATPSQTGGYFRVNPFYRHFVSPPKPTPTRDFFSRSSAPIDCPTISDLILNLQKEMKARRQNFSLHYHDQENSFAFADVKARIESSLHQIFYGDDYLKFSYRSYQANWSGGDNDVIIDFVVSYDTTAAQEQEISNRIDQLLPTIITAGDNDEQKARAIHDWVVLHIAYDTSRTRHSIYDALFSGSAVCEGYALLMFKLLETAGIRVHSIDGTGHGEPHAWNLV
jgi:transglutaminase-like putative cysteine protease